jgi:hypothetical protein
VVSGSPLYSGTVIASRESNTLTVWQIVGV